MKIDNQTNQLSILTLIATCSIAFIGFRRVVLPLDIYSGLLLSIILFSLTGLFLRRVKDNIDFFAFVVLAIFISSIVSIISILFGEKLYDEVWWYFFN